MQVKYKGHEKIGVFQPISRFISKTVQYTASYNERRRGTRMRSIEWCHFQRPSMTHNLDFNVTAILDVEYGINGPYLG